LKLTMRQTVKQKKTLHHKSDAGLSYRPPAEADKVSKITALECWLLMGL
jgi:hypothetical protein